MILDISFDNRFFLILPSSQANLIDFSEVLETSIDTLRYSVDSSKTFVKWDGVTPQFINNLSNTSGPYTYDEMIAILNTSEWTPIQ